MMHVMWRSHGSKASMLVATDPDSEEVKSAAIVAVDGIIRRECGSSAVGGMASQIGTSHEMLVQHH